MAETIQPHGNLLLLDTDVLIHFTKAGELHILPSIFPAMTFCLLENVYKELRYPAFRGAIDQLIEADMLKVIEFPAGDLRILSEYAKLRRKGLGDGESACLSVARFQFHAIGSSNLRDIKGYCRKHQIRFLTTLDFLCAALHRQIFDEARCDQFIMTGVKQGSRFPVRKISDYRCRKFLL